MADPPVTQPAATRGIQLISLERDVSAAVYGSLLVTTLIAVQWRAEASVAFIAATLVASVIVFWLAHSWARIVDRRVRGPIGMAGIVTLGRDEAPMLLPAVLPALVLMLEQLGLYSVETALDIALVVSLVQLFLWGLAAGRAAHARWTGALLIAVVDTLFGVLVVVLKVIVLH